MSVHNVHKDVLPSLGNLGVDEAAWWDLDPASRGVISAACLTKTLWSRDGARASAARLRAEGETTTAYPCPFVMAGERHWHVGHVPSMKTVQGLALAIRDLHGTRPPTRVTSPGGLPKVALVTQSPDPKENAMTETEQKAYWAEMSARFEAESKEAWSNLVAQSRAKGAARTHPVQTGAGVGLIVNQVNFGQDREGLLAEVQAGTAEVVGLVATEDGRGYQNEWHLTADGHQADIEDWVYFERYDLGHRVSHGYIDPTSRKIVQTG